MSETPKFEVIDRRKMKADEEKGHTEAPPAAVAEPTEPHAGPRLVVPETKPVAQMLAEFQQGRSHMAMVVDEFGTIVGLLTVEDVLEQIVGPIQDEYDEKSEALPGSPASDQAKDVELDGATRIRDLETEYGIDIPADGGFATLAGFLLFQLGYIPKPGDSVEYGRRKFTILAMDHNRIARVRIERLPEPAAEDATLKAGQPQTK